MAASDAVGNVTKMELKSVDGNDNVYQEVLNSRVVPLPVATYNQVYRSGGYLFALTNNTYKDTILITQISVVEKAAE